MNSKRRIEKLENFKKSIHNEKLTLHDQAGKLIHGNIAKFPSKNETGIAIINGKKYTIAVDISISDVLCLNVAVDKLGETLGFKITPKTLFLRRDGVIGGIEFALAVME